MIGAIAVVVDAVVSVVPAVDGRNEDAYVTPIVVFIVVVDDDVDVDVVDVDAATNVAVPVDVEGSNEEPEYVLLQYLSVLLAHILLHIHQPKHASETSFCHKTDQNTTNT